MLDWNAIVCFCEVARNGNFSKSAKVFNISVATLIRKINGLEKQFGIDLFYRNTRKIVLTKEGEKLYLRVQDKVSALQEELLVHQEEKSLLQQKVKIATLSELAEVYLVPAIAEIAETNPDIQIEVLLSPDLVDVDFDDIDFALRAGVPQKEVVKACMLGTETISAFRNNKNVDDPQLALGTYDETFIHEHRNPSVIAPSMHILKNLAQTYPFEVYLSEQWLATTTKNSNHNLKLNESLKPYHYDIYLIYGSKRVLKPAARTLLNILKKRAFD